MRHSWPLPMSGQCQGSLSLHTHFYDVAITRCFPHRLNSTSCDTTTHHSCWLCGSERITAHSQILCARSSVFKAQLKGPLTCSLDAVPVPEEITPQTLRDTLRFIYMDMVDPSSAEHAQHLLNAADQYALPRLRSIAERKLET